MMKLLSSNNRDYILLPNPKGKTHSKCILSARQPGRALQDKDLILATGWDSGSTWERNIAIIKDEFLFYHLIRATLWEWFSFLKCTHGGGSSPEVHTATAHQHLQLLSLWQQIDIDSSTQIILCDISGICLHYRAAVTTCRKQKRDYPNNAAYNHAHEEPNLVERGLLLISNQSAKLSHWH